MLKRVREDTAMVTAYCGLGWEAMEGETGRRQMWRSRGKVSPSGGNTHWSRFVAFQVVKESLGRGPVLLLAAVLVPSWTRRLHFTHVSAEKCRSVRTRWGGGRRRQEVKMWRLRKCKRRKTPGWACLLDVTQAGRSLQGHHFTHVARSMWTPRGVEFVFTGSPTERASFQKCIKYQTACAHIWWYSTQYFMQQSGENTFNVCLWKFPLHKNLVSLHNTVDADERHDSEAKTSGSPPAGWCGSFYKRDQYIT